MYEFSEEPTHPIGLIIATNTEYDAFLKVATQEADTIIEIKATNIKARSYRENICKTALPFDRMHELVFGRQRVIALHSTESIRRATRAVDYLAWCHHPRLIINFGTGGALTSEISNTGIYLVKTIVQYDYDISGGLSAKEAKKIGQPYFEPGQHAGQTSPYLGTNSYYRNKVKQFYPAIREVTVASGNKFVFGTEKTAIAERFNADIAEMEAVGIYLSCAEENIPSLFFKCISDGVDDEATKYYATAANVSEACSKLVIDFIKTLD